MSFPRYPKYKDSGVEWLGEVPEHWEVLRLKTQVQELDIRAGSESFVLLGLSKSIGVVPRTELEQGASQSDDYGKYKVVRAGQLVMNKMQAWNGVFGIAPIDGIVSPDYSVFDFKDKSAAEYICNLCRTEFMAGVFFMRCRGMGTAFLRLNTTDFLDVKVPIPSNNELLSIVSFLDRETEKIDALIAEQQRLIELLQEKRQAVISHAVTKGLNPDAPMKDSGIEWLGEVPAHWKVGKCRFYVKLLSGFAFPSQGFTTNESDWKLLRGVNVGVNSIRWDEVAYWPRSEGDGLDRFELQIGDLVMGMDRPLIADGMRVARISQQDLPSLLLQRVLKIVPENDIEIEYLRQLLSSDFFVAHFAPETTGVSVPHISPEQVSTFVIPIPPLSEQAKIVDQISNFEQHVAGLERETRRGVELLQERRSALISAAVTGQIDVRGLAPKEAA